MSAWKPRYCHHCGRPIKRAGGGKDAKKYCGKPCYFAAVKSGQQQFRGRLHDAWSAMADWAHEWDKQRPEPHGRSKTYKPRPPCIVCGTETSHRIGKFCSGTCLKSWRGDRACRCGNVVHDCSAYGRPACGACKAETRRQHRKMYGSYRRRCRTYGGHFNSSVKPKAVFKRDRWRCHLCGKKTHKVFAVDDQLSATVDHHPIPLSKGGDHDWHNVRCACFSCNTKKGNKWDGQLRIRLVRK